jgi:bifunctional non-homologous end joining protein LigD
LPLEKYREKRSAERTPEPFGRAARKPGIRSGGMFVVQKHAARRLHYDFRLEMETVLRSWAIPKGPSLNPGDKRLAVMVEDHPVEYGDFEGLIPEGNYGAGAVIVWDRGEYRVIDPPGADAAECVRAGKLDIEMHGFKLRGAFTLVRMRDRVKKKKPDEKEQWLLIKKRDDFVADDDVTEAHPRSVLSGLTLDELRAASGTGADAVHDLENAGAPPLKSALEPESFPLNLAKLGKDPFDGKDWLFELKYDGVRALALRDGTEVRLFGRNRREITQRYPEAALALAALPFARFAIDGEIVVPDDRGRPSFQLLQRRINVADPGEIERLSLALPVTYWAFDLLAFGPFDLRPLPLEERKEFLARLVKSEGPVRYCDHVLARGKDFFDAAAAEKLEGIVAKRRRSPYRGTRSDDWIKIKCPQTRHFVIGGWTDPAGSRTHFGALLVGAYEASGDLRFVSRVGTGFDQTRLRELHALMKERGREESPFRDSKPGEPAPPRGSHFCAPELVGEVQFSEWTDDGGLRQPSFKGLAKDVEPRACAYEGPQGGDAKETPAIEVPDINPPAAEDTSPNGGNSMTDRTDRTFKTTNPQKVFWPDESYTKGDLMRYYTTVAPWMLPYLKDRPVVLTRYPDGIAGKSFFQKDAPGFAPHWIRKEKIYSEDSHREIAYFVLESAEAIAYMANLGTIPIHIWSSHFPRLERPDWLLFDIDPKNSTTQMAVAVAHEVAVVLRALGMRPYLKTSGQMGLHVVVGLVPEYTYEQARMFAEMVARIVAERIPEAATIARDINARKGRAYIDYLQLGHGKTIAAPFTARPVAGAPVSAPLKWDELKADLDPSVWNIKTMPARMSRLKADPFLGALTDLQRLEPALERIKELS